MLYLKTNVGKQALQLVMALSPRLDFDFGTYQWRSTNGAFRRWKKTVKPGRSDYENGPFGFNKPTTVIFNFKMPVPDL